MRTDFDTLITLSTYIINHLTENKLIEYHVESRAALIDAFATELGVCFATDEDIRDQAVEEVEDKLGEGMIDGDVTETEMFNHARKEIIKSFNGEVISGLYLVESLNKISKRTKEFFINSDLIEDVFGTDEELVDFLIKRFRVFNAKRV